MNKREISKPLVIVLCIAIFFSFSFSVREYMRIHRSNIIAMYRQQITQKIIRNHGTLTEKNVDLISSWMTFEYINRIFALPADYLKNSLAISDVQYPRIPISRYAKNHKLDETQFIAQIKMAVGAYFLPH